MYELDRLNQLEKQKGNLRNLIFWFMLLSIWKTNDRDWSNISVEQLSVALRIISARLAHVITNRDTRFLK